MIGMIRQGLDHHEEDARFHQLIAEATKEPDHSEACADYSAVSRTDSRDDE